jgi:hypothetical protein
VNVSPAVYASSARTSVKYDATLAVVVRNRGIGRADVVTLHLWIAQRFFFTSSRAFRPIPTSIWDGGGLGPGARKTYRISTEITVDPRDWRAPLAGGADISPETVACIIFLLPCPFIEPDRRGVSGCSGRQPYCFDVRAVVNLYSATTEDPYQRTNNFRTRRGMTIKPGRATLVGSG